MCFVNEGTVDFYQERAVKSRKAHACDECTRTIPAGEMALRNSGLFEGEIFSGYYCGECAATRFRIHLHELHEKCRWDESWCPVGDLVWYCQDTGFRRSTHFVGQLYLAAKRNRELSRRAASRARKAVAKG